MTKMNQKEATFNAICEVTKFKGEGVVQITPEQRKQVNMILFEGFRSGKIEMSTDAKVNPNDDKDLKGYVSGLQSNWLRKDKRLNGGVDYKAKNPGSRAGSGDAQLKNLKLLFGTLQTDEQRAEVQGYIDARTEEIAAAKPAAQIDASALPEALRKYTK